MLARWGRPLVIAATICVVLFSSALVVTHYAGMASADRAGADFRVYVGFARQWLETGAMYAPHQFVGPYINGPSWEPSGFVNMYPPHAMLLFVPFAYLPALLWWAIPLTIVGATLLYWRPAWWSLPLLVLPLVTFNFVAVMVQGNTTLWGVAAIALATRWPWVAVLLAIKPTQFPVALLFARHRSWWIAGVMLGAVSLTLLPHWMEYVTVARNLDSGGPTFLYDLWNVPLLLIPIIAKLATTRRSARVTERPDATATPARLARLRRGVHGVGR